MELGRPEEPSPRDAVMSDPGTNSLKRTRSPPKLPLQCSRRDSGNELFTPAEDSPVQVNAPSPCMVGKMVDNSPKPVEVSSLSWGLDVYQTAGLRGAAPDLPGTKHNSSDGGREDGVIVLSKDAVIEGKGWVFGSPVATSLQELGEEAHPELHSHRMGRDSRENKGLTIAVKGAVHEVKEEGDPKFKTLRMGGDARGGLQVSPPKMSDDSSSGSVNSSSQAARDHLKGDQGCFNYLPKERGKVLEAKGTK